MSPEGLKEHTHIQVIDSCYLYGKDHVRFAVQKAEESLDCGEGISSNLFIETILRASGQRQIKKALEMYGLNESREIVVFGRKIPENISALLSAEKSEIIIDSARIERLKNAFSITDEEIKAVGDNPETAVKALINERIALVSLF